MKTVGENVSLADSAHASLMDRMYRHQRHIYDITRKYYLLGRDRTISGLNVPKGGTLLEVGCGTGRNLLLAGRRFPDAKLFGLDISAEMLLTAAENFAGRAERPILRVADATAFRPSEFGQPDGFDRVMIPYALSMIPDWEKAVEQALKALKPGGALHIVDFGQQEQLPKWFRTLLHGWLTRFHVTPRANLRYVLANMAGRFDGNLEFEEIARGYAWRAVITLPVTEAQQPKIHRILADA
ncbi:MULTISPECIES: class I SAM-dependent methyltransferase [Rhizobium/Agrobacterium group]|jgi:S-adenosylmethionine-diacylgycerolhomoserine-N-methlytransferase|uniref:Methylase involved in ubiquinone/menaquinone biosynthesis n=1 Tax=Agrobacterium pusense TaxID=648995 RepID=U4PZ13_9HYPH|nr:MULTISPECIES: class I SAM-dependent methyltransferase [Rhizobium/Agrobacterium group]MBM7325434.1 methyltransferase domain-containing protein [Agrobacterium sp. S2]MDH0113914.1 class I SAM-dependent methyltransferase [Agrobacterium pusense]NTE44273.1 class I SAM-dependent methyltransferase [Agrobacterium pusense]QKJ91366.1 methyltransferase domain-containing protein [Agrobacterium pusense]CDI09082.1 Methylase involved in ubiquinone/menaquinone biosynthesis [Agrobacterium pusense]